MMMVMMVPVQMQQMQQMQQQMSFQPMMQVPAMPVPEADNTSEEGRKALPTAVQARFRKTRMCTMFAQGNCHLGTSCRFAHSWDELSTAPDLRKTKLCFDFFRKQCNKADCNFAHGYHELRHMDGVYKTELCHGFAQGKCRFGSSCRFAHGEEELVSKQQPPAAAAVVPPGAWSGAQKAKKNRAPKTAKPVVGRRWSDMDEDLELEKEDDVRSMASAETESPLSGAASEADSDSVSGSD